MLFRSKKSVVVPDQRQSDNATQVADIREQIRVLDADYLARDARVRELADRLNQMRARRDDLNGQAMRLQRAGLSTSGVPVAELYELQEQFSTVERALIAAQEDLFTVQQAREAALKVLQASVDADERATREVEQQAAAAVVKPILKEMTQTARRLAALNRDANELLVSGGLLSTTLRPIPGFEITPDGGGLIGSWVRDVEGIDWSGYERQAKVV